MQRFLVGVFGVVVSGAVAASTVRAADPALRPARLLSFPSAVDIVNLNVSVLDGRERFVTDLRATDFAVFENGVRQQPMVFAQEDLPISMVILIDMSSSMKPHLTLVRRAAARLIEQLRPQDQAEVVEFSERPRVLQEFTSDKQPLLAAIRGAAPGGGTALHNTLYVTLKEVAALGKTEELHRRAIVLLSDGDDTSSVVTDDQVLEAARACEISVYSILLARPRIDGAPGSDQAHYLLSALARESGGQAYFPTNANELGKLYDRIAQELRSQYNIGYVSSDGSVDGSWRQIIVMAPDRHGLTIRHRLGYYAVPDAPLAKAKRSSYVPTASGPAVGQP